MAEEGSDLPPVWIALVMPLLRASTSSSAEMHGAVIVVVMSIIVIVADGRLLFVVLHARCSQKYGGKQKDQ
jgi:hypothetical protein